MERSHHISVWTVALDQVPEALWQSLGALLDKTEWTRAERFVFERHRRQYIAAHALKRLMLSILGDRNRTAMEWQFDIAPGGKPQVACANRPHFNLSHCEGLVACAVSHRLEIGLDVEAVTRDPPFEVVRGNFSPKEARWLDKQSASDRAIGFFRLWTLKEAYIKATGQGLAQPLQDFSFGFDPLGVTFHDPALGNAAMWRFEQKLIRGRHCLALAWRAETDATTVTIHEAHFGDLLAQVQGG